MKFRGYKIFLIVSILAATFPLYLGKFYATGDTRDIFIPLETFFHQEQIAGRLPAWNPDASWGFPVIASAQIGFFYPPLLLTRWLPIWLYLPLNLAAHVIFTALGTYFFLRTLKRSPAASFLGAISFTLGAFVFQHLTHLNVIFALAWFPWQIFAVQKFALSPSKGSIPLLSLTLGFPFLVGQIQIPLLMAIVSSAYFLFLVPRKLTAVVKLTSVAILATGLAAAQLLPTAELAWHSTRGKNSDFDIERANQYSWPLYHAPAILFPRFFANDNAYWGKRLQIEQGFFIGTIPILFALYALCALRHPSLTFWKWVTVISFLLALGSLSPFRLIGLEPSLWVFSGPARWLLFTTFSLALLAAFAWDAIAMNASIVKRYVRVVAWPAVTLVILANLALFITPDAIFKNLGEDFSMSLSTRQDFARPMAYYLAKLDSLRMSLRTSSVSLLSPFTALPLILLAATPFLLTRRHGKRVLLVATAAELILIACTTNPAIAWQHILPPPATVEELPTSVQEGQARVYTLRDFEDTGELLTNPESRDFARLHEEPRLMLVPLIHTQFGLPGVAWPASLDLTEQSQTLHHLNESLRRGETELAQELNVGAVLTKIDDVSVQALNSKPRASLILGNGSELAANYQGVSASQTVVTTNSDSPSTLIVRDTFYPGWQATVDGQATSIEENGIFRSLVLPAGEHRVEMVYTSTFLHTGLLISGLTLALSAGAMYKKRDAR